MEGVTTLSDFVANAVGTIVFEFVDTVLVSGLVVEIGIILVATVCVNVVLSKYQRVVLN